MLFELCVMLCVSASGKVGNLWDGCSCAVLSECQNIHELDCWWAAEIRKQKEPDVCSVQKLAVETTQKFAGPCRSGVVSRHVNSLSASS